MFSVFGKTLTTWSDWLNHWSMIYRSRQVHSVTFESSRSFPNSFQQRLNLKRPELWRCERWSDVWVCLILKGQIISLKCSLTGWNDRALSLCGERATPRHSNAERCGGVGGLCCGCDPFCWRCVYLHLYFVHTFKWAWQTSSTWPPGCVLLPCYRNHIRRCSGLLCYHSSSSSSLPCCVCS